MLFQKRIIYVFIYLKFCTNPKNPNPPKNVAHVLLRVDARLAFVEKITARPSFNCLPNNLAHCSNQSQLAADQQHTDTRLLGPDVAVLTVPGPSSSSGENNLPNNLAHCSNHSQLAADQQHFDTGLLGTGVAALAKYAIIQYLNLHVALSLSMHTKYGAFIT